jgi:YbbR domain-containing protein
MDVSLEYRNIPPYLEITDDRTNTVDVRLRGSSNLIKGITSKDVSTSVDLNGMKAGEQTIPLTSQNVVAPFGAQVVRVEPALVRVSLEPTLSSTVPVVPMVEGAPADGFKVVQVAANPPKVVIDGPESRVKAVESIPTLPIHIEGRKSSLIQSIDLNLPDVHLRLRSPSAVSVRIEIQRQ